MDEETAEFDLLVQRTKQQITVRENLDEVLNCSKGHPVILKRYLGGDLSLETLVIFEKSFLLEKNFDKKLKDPVWETVSLKIKKYIPFININVFNYKKILKEVISNALDNSEVLKNLEEQLTKFNNK